MADASRRMDADELRAMDEAWVGSVAAAQSAWHSPRAIIDAIVVRVAGAPPTTCERVQLGQSNETYVCDTRGGRLVVRIAHHGVPRFEPERWAITAARARGVPAPEVLLLAHELVGAELLSYCVETHLPGIPLGTLARRRGRDDLLVRTATRHAGELLAAIHDVPTRGCGEIRSDGTAALQDWSTVLAGMLGLMPPEQPSEISRALIALAEHRPLLAGTPPRLLHFDFEPGHLLVDLRSGEITGVLDFEEARSGDPAYDFAQWDVIHDAYAPVGSLALGYRERAGPSADFALRRLLSEIHFRVHQLVRGRLPAALVAGARRRLELAVNALA